VAVKLCLGWSVVVVVHLSASGVSVTPFIRLVCLTPLS